MRKKDYVEVLSKELYHCRRCKKALELIENGATNNYNDANGFTAMYWFCTKPDCLPVVKALLSKFPDSIDTTNRWDKTPLFAAYNTNNRLCWQYLVRQRAKRRFFTWFIAKNAKIDIIEFLLKHFREPNKPFRREIGQLASINFDKIYKATIRRKFIELDRFLRKKKITILCDMENPIQFWLQNHRLLGSDYLDSISKSSPVLFKKSLRNLGRLKTTQNLDLEALKTLDKHLKCSDALIDGLESPIAWWIRQEGSLGLDVLEKIRKRKTFDEILQKDIAAIVAEGLNDRFVVNGLLELIRFFEAEEDAPQSNQDSGVIDSDGHLQVILTELQNLQRPLFSWSTKAVIIGPAGLQLLAKSFDFSDLLKNELSFILEEMSEDNIFALNLLQRYCSDNEIELEVTLPKDILEKWMNVKDDENFLLEIIIDSADSVEILIRSLFDIICDHEDFEELYPKLDKLGSYLQLKEFEFANPIRWWVLEEGKAGSELLTAVVKRDFEEVITEDFAMMAYYKEFALYDSAKVGVISLATYALSKDLASSTRKGFMKILPSPLQWWSELPFGDFIGSVRLLKSTETVSSVMEDMEDYQLENNPIFTNAYQFLDVLFTQAKPSPLSAVIIELSKVEKKYQREICEYITQSDGKFMKCTSSLMIWLLLSEKLGSDVLDFIYDGKEQIKSVLETIKEFEDIDEKLIDGFYDLMLMKNDDFRAIFSSLENPLRLWFTYGKFSPKKTVEIFVNVVQNPEQTICEEIKALSETNVLNNFSDEISLFIRTLMFFPEHSHLAKLIIKSLGNPLIWWYKFSNDDDFVDTISKMDDFVDYFKAFILENFSAPEKVYFAISSRREAVTIFIEDLPVVWWMQNHSSLSDSVLFFIGELAVNMDELLEANLIWLVNNGEIHEQSMRVAFFRLVKILSEYSSIFEAVISKLENPLTWWLSSTASSDDAIACLPALERSCDLLQSFVNELECFEFDDESEEKLQIIIEVLRKKDITDVPQGALFLWSKQASIFGDKFLEVLLSASNAAENISTDLRHVFDELDEDEFLLKLEKIRTFTTDNIQTAVRDEINSWEDSFKLFTNCSENKMNFALQILSITSNFNQNAEEFVQEAVNEHKIINLLQFIERTDRLNNITNPLSLAFKRAELIQQASVTLLLDENQSENYNKFFDEIATGEQISRAFESAEILRDQQIGSFLKTELQKRIRLSAAVKAEKEPEKLVKLILEHSNEELEISNFFDDHEETGRAPDVEDILILSNLVSDRENLVAYLSRSVDSSFSWGISNITSDNSPQLVPLILGSSKGIQKEIIKFFSEESIISSFEEKFNEKFERSAVEESIINFHKELPSNLTSFFTKTIFAKIIEDKQEDWMESKLGELALSIFDKSTPAMELKMSFTALINRHGGNFGTMKRIFDQLKKKHLSEIIGDMVLAEKFLIKYIEIVLLSSFVGDNKDSSVMERILRIQPDFFTRKERSIAFTSQNKRTKSSKIFSKFGDSGGKPGVFLRTNEDIELRNHDPLALLLKQTVCSHFHLSEEKEENSELPIVPLESILGVGKMSFVTIGRVTCEEELAKLKVKNIKGSVLKVFVEPYSRSSMLKLDEKSVEKFLEPLSGVKFSDIGGTTRGFVLQTKFDLNLGQFLENKGWIFKEDAPTLESRVFMLKKILEAIDYLHENKIFHLNLKPSNVLITQDLAGRKTALDVCVRDLRENNLKKNEMMLCPGFTSPEQFISGNVSHASDLYSIARLIIFCLLDNHLFWFLCSRPNTREVLQDHIDGLEQLPELMFCVKQNLSMSGDFRQSSVQQLKAKLPSLLGELKHAAPRLKELFNFRPILKVPNSLWAGILTGPSLPKRISLLLKNLNDPSATSECSDTYLKMSYFVCYSFKAAVDKEISPKGKLWTLENIMLLFTGAIYDEKCFSFVTSQYAKKDLNLFRILRRMMEMLCFGSLTQNAPWVDVIELLNKDRPTRTRKVLELMQTVIKDGKELNLEVPVVTVTAEKIAMILLQKKMTLVQRQKEVCLETENEIDVIKCLKIDSMIRDHSNCENFSLNEECIYLQFS